jgi:hypothetical protein
MLETVCNLDFLLEIEFEAIFGFLAVLGKSSSVFGLF